MTNNVDLSSQSVKIQGEEKRRHFFPDPTWFPVREAYDIWTRYISAKGQFKCGHLVNCWVNHYLSKNQKIEESGNWCVDLQETRWESRRSIARNMGIGQHTIKDVEKAEEFLNKHGLVKTKIIVDPRTGSKIGRYISMSKKCVDLFVEGKVLIAKNTPVPKLGSTPIPKSGSTPPPPVPKSGSTSPQIREQSIRQEGVFNNCVTTPPEPTRINPKLGILDW
jgi:hypothetical protein